MIDSVRGLPGLYNILSPAAYQAQENAGTVTGSTHLHHSQDDNNGVILTLSQEALSLVRGDAQKRESSQNQTSQAEVGNNSSGEKGAAGEEGAAGIEELTPEEQRVVEKLEVRDREVRAHEQAHLASAGGLATSGPHYEYESGPDGKRYAVGGEVSITIQEGNSPKETISNAQKARSAALAPADPSAQDRRVAAEASAMIAEAMREQAEENSAEILTGSGETKAVNIDTQIGSTDNKTSGNENQSTLAKGVKKTMEILGRHAFAFQSQVERGYLNGLSYSSMLMQV